MRVLVAGATGAIGRELVPLLTSVGHSVVGLSRSHRGSDGITKAGADAIIADALDHSAVERAVSEAAPDAIVNMLTAIPSKINPRRLARDFALTNQLRAQGTRNLLDAAEKLGVKRVISQGLAYAYDPDEAAPADEDDSFWRDPPAQFAQILAALRELEHLTTEHADGLVLRIGHLYGPGTIYARDGSFVRQVKDGKVPIVGRGSAVFSFTHVHDAASAIAAALDKKDVNGALNIVDDDPAPIKEWLPVLAEVLGAPKPKRAPVLMARLAVGGWGVAFMTRLRGADNARARLRLNWRPRYASWRVGFQAELGSSDARAEP